MFFPPAGLLILQKIYCEERYILDISTHRRLIDWSPLYCTDQRPSNFWKSLCFIICLMTSLKYFNIIIMTSNYGHHTSYLYIRHLPLLYSYSLQISTQSLHGTRKRFNVLQVISQFWGFPYRHNNSQIKPKYSNEPF